MRNFQPNTERPPAPVLMRSCANMRARFDGAVSSSTLRFVAGSQAVRLMSEDAIAGCPTISEVIQELGGIEGRIALTTAFKDQIWLVGRIVYRYRQQTLGRHGGTTKGFRATYKHGRFGAPADNQWVVLIDVCHLEEIFRRNDTVQIRVTFCKDDGEHGFIAMDLTDEMFKGLLERKHAA